MALFGADNWLPEGAIITAQTENSLFPATNLGFHRLTPTYQTADKCVKFDGAADFARHADNAGFSITGDMTIEITLCPDLDDTAGVGRHIVNKWGALGQYGYQLAQNNAALILYLSTDGTAIAQITFSGVLVAGAWHRYKVVYDASATEVSLWIDGAESGRANNATQTGTATLVGVIPGSIFDGNTDFTLGNFHGAGGASCWDGRIANFGIAAVEFDHSGYLASLRCVCYCDMLTAGTDLLDISGSGNHLTGTSITTSNFSNCTAWCWLAVDATQVGPALGRGIKINTIDGEAAEYAWTADHANFDITLDLTAQMKFCTDRLTAAFDRYLIHKTDGTNGYSIGINIFGKIFIIIENAATTDATIVLTDTITPCYWHNLEVVYDASDIMVDVWLDGVNVARATGAAAVFGCSLVGTVPAAIGVNATRVTIGANAAGGVVFTGIIDLAAIRAAEIQGIDLNPYNCAGFWDFDDNLIDYSPREHDLTGVGIDDSDYVYRTANKTPLVAALDRRHNLPTGAILRLWKGRPHQSSVLVATYAVEALKTAVEVLSTNSSLCWWWEFSAPELSEGWEPPGYIRVPFAYLGTTFTPAFDISDKPQRSNPRAVVRVHTIPGNPHTKVKSDQYWTIQGQFPEIGDIDMANFELLEAWALQGKAILYTYDTEDMEGDTRFYYWLDVAEPRSVRLAQCTFKGESLSAPVLLQELISCFGE